LVLVEELRFRGAHTGYLRLTDPVRPVRTLALEPTLHALVVHDTFEAASRPVIEVPVHLAPALAPEQPRDESVRCGEFTIRWRGAWRCSVEETWVSSSYGVRSPSHKLVFRRDGTVEPLTVLIAPTGVSAERLWAWAETQIS